MIGTITKRVTNGYMVDVFQGGQHVVYGPMHFIGRFPRVIDGGNARTEHPERTQPNDYLVLDPYEPGDQVFITPLGTYRDQFIIVGPVTDMNPEPRQDYQIDTDGDGVIDIIQASYTQGG